MILIELECLRVIDKKRYYVTLCEDAQQNKDYYQAEAEKKIIVWEYANGKRYDLTPHYFERNHERPARRTKMANSNSTAYGLDGEGAVWVSKIDSIQFSSYRSENDNQLLMRHYREGNLDSIEEVIFEDGRPVRYVNFIVRHGISVMQSWHFEEYYSYDENNRTHTIKRDEYWNVGNRHYQYSLFYGNKNELVQIKEISDDKTIYLKMSKFEAQDLRFRIRERIKEELHNEMLKILDKLMGDSEKVCFAAIYLHDDPTAVCDPIVQLGLESVRMEQLMEKSSLDILWYSGEHPTEYQFSNENHEVREMFRVLLQYWEAKDIWWKESKKLWQEIALALNENDYSHLSAATDNFVCFVDEEAFEAKKDLPKSVPAHRLALLREKGLYF